MDTGDVKLFLLVHGGYDFEPTTLAVCETKVRADELLAEHYTYPTNADYPWNGCFVREIDTDRFLPWPGVRSGQHDGDEELESHSTVGA